MKRLLIAAVLMTCAASALLAQNPPPKPPVVVTPAQPTAAQQAAAAAGKTVTNEQIADAIKNSGLTEQQIRDRLKNAGYDAALADPFFAQPAQVQPGAPAQTGAQSAAFAKALRELGILTVGVEKPPESEGEKKPESEEDRASSARASARAGGVFGKDVFAGITSRFDPVTAGPVDPSYRLGVGDQLQLVMTGQVELAYQLDIGRDGTVLIPDVGQITLAGLTLDGARSLLKTRMARSYSGLASGEARLDLTISRIRSNSVFVIGEVENPGAYQVNALSTVFYALARAGGPTTRGSFRAIEVRRAGRLLRTIDLYDYLLRGDASNDIRTEQGDIIFVPLNTRAVAITGAVRRPAIFELKDDEQFGDLLVFAGGLLTSASLDRVQVDRVLPPEQRKPGFERVKSDIELHGSLAALRAVPLYDSDIITVFSIGDLRRNTLSIAGAVFQPGVYEFTNGMTLDTLLRKAEGTLPWALTDRVKLLRSISATGQSETFSLNLADSTARHFAMAEFDQVLILDGRVAYPSGIVSVTGAVRKPFETSYAEHLTLRDLIDLADGLREDAASVTVARRRIGPDYSDTTSILYHFALDAKGQLDSSAGAFMLERDDHVLVRSAPGFRSQRFATIDGLFVHPGNYALTENQDRLSDLVNRAGGTLPTAYDQTFRLIRDGKSVAIDFSRAMRGDRVHNVLLQAGDVLSIGSDPRTVFVTGAVARPSLIGYRPGLSMRDYIELAGGPTEKGNMHKATVEYPSGYSRRLHRYFGVWYSQPDVVSGSVISVPEKLENATSAWETLARVLSTLGTLAITYTAIRR